MFKVGDIVITKDKEQKKMTLAVVTSVEGSWSVNVMFSNGDFGWRNQDKVRGTGRHIDMQSVLDSIK